jgi:hypothetical protein
MQIMTNAENGLVLAPNLDNIFRYLQKHYKPGQDAHLAIELDHVLVASRLSQLYWECSLSAQFIDRIRILSNNKAVRANTELRERLSQIPELANYDLISGDPAFRYLIDKALAYPENQFTAPVIVEAVEDLDPFFHIINRYSFFKRRKKTLAEEFATEATEMEALAKKYHLPGRYNHNARVTGESRPKRKKVNLDFLNDFKFPAL